MDIDRVLNFSSNCGKVMMESGAETYRVEETVYRICKSFNVDEVEVFASPTAVIVSIIDKGKVYSIVKRINSRCTDLNKIHLINSLSRKINNEKLSIDECENKLKIIQVPSEYSLLTKLFFSGLGVSTFTVLFGGDIREFIFGFIIGIVIKLICMNLDKLKINQFFIDSIASSIVAIYSIILLNLGFIQDIDKLIAGSIMLLVPGLLLTNSIRDIMEGQLVSGMAKISEVFFIGVSIAVGIGFVLYIYFDMGVIV